MTSLRLICLLLVLAPASWATADELALRRVQRPLSASQQQRFFGSRKPARDPHEYGYLVSNERGLQHFAHALSQHRAAQRAERPRQKVGYVGIGAEQNYSYIPRIGAEVAWLYDIDPGIVRTHKIHGANFKALDAPSAAERIDQWIAFYRPGRRRAAVKQIAQQNAGDADLPKIIALFKKQAPRWYSEFRQLKKASSECFLNDEAAFDHVRQMFRNGRIRLSVAGHENDKVLADIGQSAKRLNVSIEAIYLSNSLRGSYLHPVRSIDSFNENLNALLPVASRAVVVHTSGQTSRWTYQSIPFVELVKTLGKSPLKIFREGPEGSMLKHFSRRLADGP